MKTLPRRKATRPSPMRERSIEDIIRRALGHGILLAIADMMEGENEPLPEPIRARLAGLREWRRSSRMNEN